MPRLVEAEPEHIERIYRESHALWGVGLSRRDYRELWEEIRTTPWGSEYARFYAWVGDNDRLLSSLKVYRPRLQVLEHRERTLVLGAIFTPRSQRRRGHAAAAIRAALDQGRDSGARTAMLFSDIGTRYYEALGFHEIPAAEQWGPIPVGIEPPRRWVLRDMTPADIPELARMHGEFCAGRPFAILRDEDHWEFIRTRAFSFFSRTKSHQVRQRWRIAECDGRPEGYLLTVEGRGEWNVREIGARGGDFERMAQVLHLGAVEALRDGFRRFYAWMPHELLDHLPDWEIRSSSRRGALPMVLPLTGMTEIPALQVPGVAYIPYQDQF